MPDNLQLKPGKRLNYHNFSYQAQELQIQEQGNGCESKKHVGNPANPPSTQSKELAPASYHDNG